MEDIKAVEYLRSKLNDVSSHYQSLLKETHNKALLQNERQSKQWEDYKKDHVKLSDRLMHLRDKLSHTVMVPIGKRALMRGQLVHTNEILVCLGDGWFAKQSAKQAADICQRRIQHCNEMLTKLKKEEELLNSRKSFPFESEAFNSGYHTQEIIEPYDEEEEKKWREQHRHKEKEYRRKLTELRKAPITKIETEEDLWRRLDALDVQEELEDELNRMEEDIEGEEDEDEDYEDNSESESSNIYEEEEQNKKSSLQRRVSFKEETGNSESDVNCISIDDNLIRIFFKHSDMPSLSALGKSDEITTPSDIYSQYLKQKSLKSILKPSPSCNFHSFDLQEKSPCPMMTSNNVGVNQSLSPVDFTITAISEDVVERTPDTPTVTTTERPVSRFKAARMAYKK